MPHQVLSMCKLYALTRAVCELLICPEACRCIAVHIGNEARMLNCLCGRYVHRYVHGRTGLVGLAPPFQVTLLCECSLTIVSG